MPITPRRRALASVLVALALGSPLGTLAGASVTRPPHLVPPHAPRRAQPSQSEPPRSAPRSAPIADVRYEITFDSAHAAARRVGVRMTFTARGRGPVLLALPAWTPGHYEIAYYARQVSAFTATGAGGRPLPWDKVDYQTWRVRPDAAGREGSGSERSGPDGAGPITVAFEVQADRLELGRSWARPDFLLLSGTNVFLYPVGRPLDHYAATVRVNTAPGWRVATGMTPVRITPGRVPNEWGEASYHDLVDMPFFVGRFDLDSVLVSGRWTRLATYPVGSVDGERRRRALDGLARAIPPEVAVFGEAPWRTYTAFQVADAEAGGGFGALEHQNSHVALVPAGSVDAAFLPGLRAHEIFHAFNVKRLRPADLVPYRYDREQPTPLLWVSEGLTDYYADLAQLRGRLSDSAAFLAAVAAKIATVAAAPPVALEDASLDTWAQPADGTGNLYYPKGALAGFLLDVLIRDASDNRGSLDTVMRDLYERTYKQHFRGFTTEEFFAACARAARAGRGGEEPAGRTPVPARGADAFDDFVSFRRRYVHGREPFPWAAVLPLAGLRLETDTVRQVRLGFGAGADSSGALVVNQVLPDGPLAAAGVRPGDRLLALGDVDVRGQGWRDAVDRRYADRAGADLPVRVRRGAETLTLAGRVAVVPRAVVRVVADPAAPGRARRVRGGIFRGTTGA